MAESFRPMKGGVIVRSSGHSDVEIDVEILTPEPEKHLASVGDRHRMGAMTRNDPLER